MTLTPLGEAWLIERRRMTDDRGSLSVTYEEAAFREHGLNTQWPEQIYSITRGCGIVRGMHWQVGQHSQIKFVRCLTGMVVDVIVDIRPSSKEFGIPKMVELSADNGRGIYIPTGFAHGFQCISESCAMLYSLSAPYDRRASRSFFCEDTTVNIKWPLPVMHLSDQDASAPLFADVIHAHP